MDKEDSALRTIGEVAEELNLPAHVLRFWETKFTQLKPNKRRGRHRYYRPEDIEKLKQIRENLNLSQNDILDRLGYKDRFFRSNISQYERGEREPSLLVLLAYARLAEVTVDELIDDDLDLP